MSPSPKEKYASRVDELASLEVELDGGRRPGGPGPVVGRLLEAAGDLLRRTRALAPDQGAVERALGRVSDAALRSWGAAVEVDEVSGRLLRAASQAVEVALPDAPDDAATLAGWAMQGLFARDRLESVVVALERLGALGREDAKRLAQHVRASVTSVDRRCRPTVAALTTLNSQRRPEAGLLDEGERERAWWFAAKSGVEHDRLVSTLGGDRPGTLAGLEKEVHEVVMSRRARRVSFDDLLRFDLGLAGEEERALIRRRAREDPELELALAAMEEGERAIDEVLQGAAHAPAPQPAATEGPRGRTPDVVEENGEFKVLVLRGPRTVQVVLQPSDPRRLAAAAVFRSEDGATPIAPVPGEDGLHFELGAPELLRGRSARLVVKLTDGQSRSLDIRL